MSRHWLLRKEVFRFLILNLLIVIAYAIGVNLSHKFSTLPGAVASVWFPSGMTLALVYLLGNRVLLGIAGGSILAVSLELLQIDAPISIFYFLLINVACALGNCLQPLIANYLIKNFAKHKNIFSHVDTVLLYVVAAIFSPVVSATVGMTSLCLAGLVPWHNYGISWLTWWIASAIAHLIFTPTILLYEKSQKGERRLNLWEVGLVLLSILLVSWVGFGYSYRVEYLLLPLLIWTVSRCGKFFASLLVSIVSLIAIFASVQGYGFYNKASPNESLLLLQSFMAVFALTSLILSAVIDERTEAQLLLMQSIESLESQVIERTTKLQQSETSLKQANLELEKLVNLDSLTQIANRRCFDDRIRFEWERLSREQQPLSLLLFDIDYFKRYNDCYGHQVGDNCLKAIAQALEQTLYRPADLVARYGGEEFVAILPNTDLDGAIIVAEEIRSAIVNLKIPHQNSDISDMVTVSVGITTLIPSPKQKSSTLIQEADIALYRAKQQGRNRSVIFNE
ncbi:MAG: diguanylate cyclase [Alkalinema sp. CAN_BIN05]|nr:diguanylate cyclase [Alkalinema sp. CAN_BIN05]